MSGLSSEIVIGIDFGTTHSGVSWAVNGGTKQIRLINNWPNPQSRVATSDKVPSTISYKDGKPFRWGYQVKDDENQFKWIKILLEPDSKYAQSVEPVKRSNEALQALNKSAVSVVADYLKLIWDYTMTDIERRQGPDFREIYALKVVMSVPAMWTPGAKDRTLQAAKQAGLGEHIQLVTEPEAAALAVLKDKSEMREMQPGDCFVVCDAGGGTVDLISYEVEQTNPLQVKECAIGAGELCGSVFLDMSFQKYIMTRVGERQYNKVKAERKRKMLTQFEYEVKRSFDTGSDQEYTVELRGVADDEANGIAEGEITFKSSVVRTIFDHICLQIDRLVAQQIEQIKSKNNRRVKAILLVGGFGESGYLYDILNHAHKSQGIHVLQVNGAWSSICRGATLWGLEHSEHFVVPTKTVKSRLARYSYGIAVNQPFDPNVHNPVDRYWDVPENAWYARNQMKWFINRGDEFEDDAVLNTTVYHSLAGIGFLSGGMRDFSERLLYSDRDIPPKRLGDGTSKQLCEVSWQVDVTKIWANSQSYKRDGTKWRDCYFHVLIGLGNANLMFGVVYGEELVAGCEAKYPED